MSHPSRPDRYAADQIEAWQRDNIAVDRAPVGIAQVAPDGAWLRVNPRLCEIVGYPEAELLTLSFQDITHPDDLDADLTLVEQMLAGEIDRYQMEKRYIRRDGSLTWILLTVSLVRQPETGQPLYFVSVIEDIHTRKQAEAALAESERRFRTLMEGVQEYALFITDVKGIVQAWHPGIERVLGWDEPGIVGQPLNIIFTPEDQAAGIPEQEMATAAREGRASDERWHIRRDGSRFWSTGVIQSIREETTGDLLGFSKVMTDATKRYEDEQRLAQKAALIDLASDAIFVQQVGTNRITLWSQGAERLYGWSRTEAIGQIANDLLQTEFPEGMDFDSVTGTLLRDGHWEGDLHHRCKDGRQIIVASRWALQRHRRQKDQPIAVLEVNRDVTAERERVKAERRDAAYQRQIAETVQRALLTTPPPNAIPGLTFHALYRSADQDALIGGDFFDIHLLRPNLVSLIVGDTTGHGIEAVTDTAELKFVLRAFLRENPSPADALARLNVTIADRARLNATHLGGSYVALTVCVLNTLTGEMSASCAGIEPPIILQKNSREALDISECGGPLLGILPDATYNEFRAVLSTDDMLVLSTDGITEVRHRSGDQPEFFGHERLKATLLEGIAETDSLAEIAAFAVDQAQQFGNQVIDDDICLLLARRSPVSPS